MMFENIKADIDRYAVISKESRLSLIMYTQGIWASFEYRYSRWVLKHVHIPGVRKLLLFAGRIWHKVIQIATGIDLPPDADIGKGLYIGHFGGIIVAHGARIGENCNLSQGVTIGYAGRGDQRGCPTIGDRVYIAPGAKIVGRITIGNDVAIGANAVVTKDLPDMAVAVGVPAKIISYDGSADFVQFRK